MEPEEPPRADVTCNDLGGLGKTVEQVREMIELPLKHPELFQRLGIEPPKGVLLRSPRGTGKTLLARAVANEAEARFFHIAGPEIMGRCDGESEQRLRDVTPTRRLLLEVLFLRAWRGAEPCNRHPNHHSPGHRISLTG